MKIIYGQLKELLPGLRASPKEIGEKLTLAGLMMDGLSDIKYRGRPDHLISLEVRQNRADCLGVLGVAREVAAYYDLRLKLPEARVPEAFKKQPSVIRVEARRQIKRAMAYELSGVSNRTSPAWLKEFLSFYDINSINLLVDLSNYVMFFTGCPSHLLDKDKMQGSLRWTMNKTFQALTTLDGSLVKLNLDEIVLEDDKNILGLAGIVGGQAASIDIRTKNIIVEMAIYDRVLVRQNARSLKISTEASTRLEKDLDSASLDYAMNLLVSLILREAGGQISFKPFSYYPKRSIRAKIVFDFLSPSLLAGIDISPARVFKILNNLRFKVVRKPKQRFWRVTPPGDRLDVNIPEDLVEEVIRVAGYDLIPSDEPPAFKIVPNITPQGVKLAEKARDILSSLGFDEILSWPLTRKEINLQTNYRAWKVISTQNSVNEECPDLRQSIASSLISQLKEYQKKNINQIRLFEIGKVFGQEGKNYLENDSLGLLLCQEKGGTVNYLKQSLETILRSLGLAEISYSPSSSKPVLANPYSCWDVLVNQEPVGIIYKMVGRGQSDSAFAEVNIDKLVGLLKEFRLNPVVELTQKLVVLDANVELGKKQDVQKVLKNVAKRIGPFLWSLEVIDDFAVQDKVRYTIRISYRGLSDEEAKAKHLKLFNLVKE